MKIVSLLTLTTPLAVSVLLLILNLNWGIKPIAVIAQDVDANIHHSNAAADEIASGNGSGASLKEQTKDTNANGVDVDEDDEATCSLNPSKQSEGCSTPSNDKERKPIPEINMQELTHQVVQLTDDNFDEVTMATAPATWLIMFKTDACAICQKAKPVFEDLAVDTEIVEHNFNVESGKEIREGVPEGPIYIATVDAGWSGKDTSKRFEIDATPTIVVLRNDGQSGDKGDSRSYYMYYGQRAIYPLRNYVLGAFQTRKKLDIPHPLPENERKPKGWIGRTYEYFSPNIWWTGGLLLKIICAWYVFLLLLGLFLRVHNYAWGKDADGEEEEEVIRGDSQGYKIDQSEASARRQRLMWERKAQNHEKFKKKREAAQRAKEAKARGAVDDDDDFVGVGRSVKKSEVDELKKTGLPSKNKAKSQ